MGTLLLLGISAIVLGVLVVLVARIVRPVGERYSAGTSGDQLLSLDDDSLAEALSVLTRRQRRVVGLRLGLESDAPLSAEDVARELGIPRDDVVAAGRRAREKIERHLFLE